MALDHPFPFLVFMPVRAKNLTRGSISPTPRNLTKMVRTTSVFFSSMDSLPVCWCGPFGRWAGLPVLEIWWASGKGDAVVNHLVRKSRERRKGCRSPLQQGRIRCNSQPIEAYYLQLQVAFDSKIRV